MVIFGTAFLWMLIHAFLWGFAFWEVQAKITAYRPRSLTAIPVSGIVILTVYAECFSLFGGVGAVANVGLILADLLILLFLGKPLIRYMKAFYSRKGRVVCGTCVALAILLLVLLYPAMHITPTPDWNYDTYLYHAQAIHWIEDYGLVPGLGNLHHRFAYNSSFFCLQALFSMRFLFGRSLHSVNAVFIWMILCYLMGSMKLPTKQRIVPSDLCRIFLIILLIRPASLKILCAPGTDIMVQALIGYLFINWFSLLEDRESDTAPYAWICLCGLFAISLKLSAALIILLTLLPLYRLIKDHAWKKVLFYSTMGVLLIAPFLIRNVMISGYLIYPLPELDLFSVDWKMNTFMAVKDRREIKAWAWGLNNWRRSNAAVSEWFPVWWTEKLREPFLRGLLLSHILILPIGLLIAIKGRKKAAVTEKGFYGAYVFTGIVMLLNLLYFLFAAPDPRFGAVYLILLPVFVIGIIGDSRNPKEPKRTVAVILDGILLLSSCLFLFVASRNLGLTLGRGYGFYDRYLEGTPLVLDGQEIDTPVTGDQISYEYFPSTPYPAILDVIELRGEDLSKGFRVRSTYQDALLSTNGKTVELP